MENFRSWKSWNIANIVNKSGLERQVFIEPYGSILRVAMQTNEVSSVSSRLAVIRLLEEIMKSNTAVSQACTL